MTETMITDYDIRGTNETGLTIECAWNVGKALADWLPTAGHIAVMYPATQHDLANAIIEGARLQGRDVMDGGEGGQSIAATHIQTGGLSGAAIVSVDAATGVSIIELLQETGRRIERETGLSEIVELVEGGNFVPAAVKGELSAIA
jgi:phosphomannomutase